MLLTGDASAGSLVKISISKVECVIYNYIMKVIVQAVTRQISVKPAKLRVFKDSFISTFMNVYIFSFSNAAGSHSYAT